jgi:hypothetical protein
VAVQNPVPADVGRLYNQPAMGVRRHLERIPPVAVSAGALRSAHQLADSLRQDGLLRTSAGTIAAPGRETSFVTWTNGIHAAVHDRYGSSFRHWRLLDEGGPVAVEVTSDRIRQLPWGDIPLASIKRIRPRSATWSVVDVELRSGDRLRLWGEYVPRLIVMLGWLTAHEVVMPPKASVGTAAA